MTTVIDLDQAIRPDLSTHRVVIVGGTGSVGEGIVRAWLRSGAEVIVPSRSQESVDTLRAGLGDDGASPSLHRVLGDYTSFASAEAMAARVVGEFGDVTDAIATIGGWWQGKPLWEVTQAEWDRFFVDLTTAHVATVRAWIPRLPDAGSYQLILGGSAFVPVPGASVINMEQAALLMMRQVLAAEVGDQRRVFAQVLGPVDARGRQWTDPDWVSSAEVGLVSTTLAADPSVASTDFKHLRKGDILATLRTLHAYPEASA